MRSNKARKLKKLPPPPTAHERLQDAMLYGAMAFLTPEHALAVFCSCRFFRESVAMVQCALHLMGCADDWFAIAPRERSQPPTWNSPSCEKNQGDTDHTNEPPQQLPPFSLATIDQPARVLPLADRVARDLAPFCYRAFPSKDPVTDYFMRPLVVPIAKGGAKDSASDVRERLNEVVAMGFGDAVVVDSCVLGSPFGIHWDNSDESLGQVACRACARVKTGALEWFRPAYMPTPGRQMTLEELLLAGDVSQEYFEETQKRADKAIALLSAAGRRGASRVAFLLSHCEAPPDNLVLPDPALLSQLPYTLQMCQHLIRPLKRFFARANVAQVTRLSIKWPQKKEKKKEKGGEVEDPDTVDVELIAGVSRSGFLVGVYVLMTSAA